MYVQDVLILVMITFQLTYYKENPHLFIFSYVYGQIKIK